MSCGLKFTPIEKNRWGGLVLDLVTMFKVVRSKKKTQSSGGKKNIP